LFLAIFHCICISGVTSNLEEVENKNSCLECGTMDIEDFSPNKKSNEQQICGVHKIALCRCLQSKTFPLCDGTHEVFNKETNSNIKPIILKVEGEILDTSNAEDGLKEETTKKVKRKIVNSEELKRSAGNDDDVVPSKTIEDKKKEEKQEEGRRGNSKKKELPTPVDRKSITAVYTAEEVAKHCTEDDCWMIIKGHVYDVTPYFEFHPGGHQALMNFAGKDGTENVEFHSSKMMFLLNKYFYIGKLQKEGGDNGCILS